jgi:hypothetical protein
VRPTSGDVRDRVDPSKSDHGPSSVSYRGFQRRTQLKTDLREIFEASRLSTFSTVSAKTVHSLKGAFGPIAELAAEPPDLLDGLRAQRHDARPRSLAG